MAQRMTGSRLGDAAGAHRALERALQGLLIEVVAAFDIGTWVDGALRGGKHVLPAPFLARVGIFALQGEWQVNIAKTNWYW